MIHGVGAHDRVEGFIVKRQALIHIYKLEFDIGYVGVKRLLIGSLNSLLIDVKPSDATLEFLCQIESRSA